MCGVPSHFPPPLQTQAAYTISFISFSGGALPDGSSLEGERLLQLIRGEERGTGQNYFRRRWPRIGGTQYVIPVIVRN